MEDFIIADEHFAEFMERTVEPFLGKRRTEFRIPRENDGSLYCVRFDADSAVGTVLLSHGFTETAEKHREAVYYFVTHGYHVCQLEHCGHGHSYRLAEDPSLVHIDRYQRYVQDLLDAADAAKRAHPELPLFLYAHSMGGGIAAAALAAQPKLFAKAVLSSPMIRPLTAGVPWPAAKLLAGILCGLGKARQYVPGGHAFDGRERFEDSASTCRERFEYYRERRCAEPLYQMNAASCGWLNEAAKMNRYLMREGWKRIETPILLFQAQDDAFVSAEEQDRFAEKMRRAGNAPIQKVRVAGTKHEIFGSEARVLGDYWNRIFQFIEAL